MLVGPVARRRMEHVRLPFPDRIETSRMRARTRPAAYSLTAKRPSDATVIWSARRCAPVPSPGKFFGLVVTRFHSTQSAD